MVNVPPLLCSTPPPIDFGEEDDDSGLQSTIHLDENDDYSEFGLVSGAKEPLPSPDPVAEYREKPPEDMLENKQTAEAFNYQVKQSIDYDVYRETAPPTPPPLSLELDEEEAEQNGHVDHGEHPEEDEEETNTNESVPSLKLDSLSLYSTESVSASTLSPLGETDANAVAEPITKANVVLSHQVTLEDVSDDSDEECSPKKPKELFIPEGAKDFFAIEVLATPTLPNGDGVHDIAESPRNKSLEDESFKRWVPPEKQEPSLREDATTQQEKPTESGVFQFANFEAEPKNFTDKEITPEQHTHQAEPPKADDDDFEDFGDFADFSAAESEDIKESRAIATTPKQAGAPTRDSSEAKAVTLVEPPQDDGFDDFQEFATPEKATTPVQNHEEEEDDDFGDFSEPAVVAVQVPPPPPPAAVHLSLDERVKPVLEMMFPQSKETSSTSLDKRRPLAQCQRFNFGAIEHARALKYEWGSSEMRHALVRSLGIDSRNILFGDKWNSSMPRFAANLSFDPLKPMKPLSPTNATATASTLEPTASSSSSSSYQGLETDTGAQASQAETRPSQTHGEGISIGTASNGEERPKIQDEPEPESQSLSSHHHIESPAAASAAAVAPTAATLPPALSADSPAHQLNGGEQLHQQQQSEPEQFDLRATPSPTQPPLPLPAQEEIMGSSSSSIASYAVPLKETHIYTPSKSDTAVAKTTTLAPIDFDYEMAATGIIIDETVVKKEYRDVEYKPPFGLDSPSKVSSFDMPPPQATAAGAAAAAEDDDFSDFQSMPAVPRSRLDTPTFGEQMILSPAILLPQAIPLAKKATSPSSTAAASIEWGDNALASINAEEMARIEELFSSQTAKPPTISASVAKKKPSPPPAPTQAQEDDEWSDFVSVPVATTPQQNSPRTNNNNNVNGITRKGIAPAVAAAPKDDDWSDFVSSTPVASAARPTPQFNSGAWQAANFYNNPLSLYQAQQQQQQHHSNLVPSHNNNNNNVPAIPQQIHIMHDFSTAPVAGGLMGVGTTATYQQHHQRQQFQIGNAKVAPRISLIPDLSFVAPALPTNAGAFMGALPKPSFGGGKK